MATTLSMSPVTPRQRVQEIVLPPLHDAQRIIAKHEARYRVVCCGRRWGKTMLGVVVCLRAALKGGRVWWVAPTYQQALEGWRYLQKLTAQLPMARTRVSELTVSFGKGSIQVKTGDNPDNLRGAGLDGVVLDEAAVMKPDVWELILRPALADKQGWALFISTPQHYNWFYDLYTHAERDTSGEWAAWQHPTWDNPFIPEAEIEAARRDMDNDDFLQEFGASFTAVGGAVFPLLSANRPVYLRPMPSGVELRRVGVGMDWGTTRQHNASVVCGGITSTGAVWIRSAWLNDSGDDNAWFREAERCKCDYGATFARVDRSQSSAKGRLKGLGYSDADTGVANVEARVGAYQGLIQARAIYFDADGPGMADYYRHMSDYHRDPETGKPVEERDDDVDAGGYLVTELVQPRQSLPATARLDFGTRLPAGTWKDIG